MTTPEPSQPPPSTFPQIDPSDGYAFYQILDGSTVLAEIVATKYADPKYGSGMAKETEYWRIKNEKLKTFSYPSLSVKRVRSGKWDDVTVGSPPFNAADASFSTPVGVTWGGAATASCHKPSSDYGFAVDVEFKSGYWRGTMNFYRSSTDPVFKTIANGATEVFNLSTYSYTQSCVIYLP